MSVNEGTLTKSPRAARASAPGLKASRLRLFMTGLVIVAGGLGLAAYFARHRKAGSPVANGSGDDQIPGRVVTARVVVTQPRRGGLVRTVRQPGTVLAFDKAALYAKVSGYLVRQKVDIGDIVKKNEVLAEVDAPEFFRSRDQFRAFRGRCHG